MEKNYETPNRMFENLMLTLKGAIIGTGAILPGVSGGVLCVAFGIYEPMMEFLAHPILSFKKLYKMFIPFLIGWILGFVILARFVEILFKTSPTIALMLFAGLIFGTIPDLLRKSAQGVNKVNWTAFILSLVCFYIFFQMLSQSITVSIQPDSLWYMFCGLVWGLSLVIPGLSSSSILIFMGLYEPMTSGIANLDFSVIVPLMIGIGVTVSMTARFVYQMFENHYSMISQIVIGILLASTLLIVPTRFDSLSNWFISMICFLTGFFISQGFDHMSIKQEVERMEIINNEA